LAGAGGTFRPIWLPLTSRVNVGFGQKREPKASQKGFRKVVLLKLVWKKSSFSLAKIEA